MVGSAVYYPTTSTSLCWKLRAEHSILSAELFAIWQALNNSPVKQSIVLFTDLKSALKVVTKNTSTYLNICDEIAMKLSELNEEANVYLHWVKAHIGIVGNEMAEKAAN